MGNKSLLLLHSFEDSRAGRKTTMRRRRPFGPPAVVFRLLVVVFVVVSVSFFASMRAANALSADESDDDDDERVEFDVDADDYSNAFATLMNAAEDDDDENMESYALQLDDFTGEILKPPRQKARREPEWMASLTSLPSNCTRSRKGGGRETLKEVPDVSLRRMPLRLPTNRIALKDIFVTRENYKRLGFGGIKRYYALPPNAAAIAKKYRWKRCAVLGNSGARKDVNALRVAFLKRLRKWREHSRRSLSLSLSLS